MTALATREVLASSSLLLLLPLVLFFTMAKRN
jgi:hypothetical protein